MPRPSGRTYTWHDTTDHVTKMDTDLYYNVQVGVEEAKDSLATHTTSLGALQTEVDSLDTTVTSHTSDISDLNDDVSDLQDEVAEIWEVIEGGSSATMTASNTTGWITNTFAKGSDVNISFTWSSTEGEQHIPTGNGAFKLSVNNIDKSTQTVQQGSISFNIKDYLSNGTNAITCIITDVYGTKKTFKLTVDIVSLTVTSTFDYSLVRTASFNFNCVLRGSSSKTLYLKIDDTVVYNDTTTQSTKSYVIPITSLTHGVHRIRCYATATIGGSTVTSNVVDGYIIYYTTAGSTVICITPPALNSVDQYSSIEFEYQVYTDTALSNHVTITDTIGTTVETVSDTTVDRTRHTVTYRVTHSGSNVFTVTCGQVTSTFTITVTSKSLPVSIETQGIEMNLTAKGKSQSVNPNQWTDSYGTTCTFAHTPIWENNAEEGTRLVLIDNTCTVNKKLFQTDFKANGKTIEIDFSVEDGNSLSEVIFSSLNGNVGLYIDNYSAHFRSQDLHREAFFNSGERILVAFVVEQRTANRLIHTYINGVWSGVTQYATTDTFIQPSPQNLTISAVNCKVKVYNIRSYTTALDRETMLNNFIASHENVDTLMEIYDRCDVMTNGEIDVTKLNVPYIILKTLNPDEVLPQFKKDYKYINVTYIDNNEPTRNWTTTGTQINVQGTSSAGYYRKNYTIKCKYNSDSHMYNYLGTEIDGWVLDTTKDVKEQTFVLKADVASSQMVNNICSQMFAQNNSPVKTPRQIENDNATLQANIGFPVFVFWRNNLDEDEVLGCYNLNTGKDSASSYAWNEMDMYLSNEDNTSDLCNQRTNVFPANWFDYMEESNPDTSRDSESLTDYPELVAYMNWIVTCDPTTATGQAITPVTYDGVTYTTDSVAYRNAKFKATAGDHLMLRNQYYYYCVIEMLLGVDSMTKNDMFSYFYPTEE